MNKLEIVFAYTRVLVFLLVGIFFVWFAGNKHIIREQGEAVILGIHFSIESVTYMVFGSLILVCLAYLTKFLPLQSEKHQG